MQDKNISVSEIVGTPQVDTWAQVFTGNNTEQQDKGRLFYLLKIKNETDEETASIGKLLSQRFEENYFQNTDTPFESLRKAMTGLDEVSQSRGISEFEAAAILFINNAVYACTLNSSSTYLKRKEKFAVLLKGESGINLTSGYFQEDDLFILASSGFINLVGLSTIINALDHNTPEDISQGLAPIVLGSPVNSTSACLILRVNRNKVTEEVAPDELAVNVSGAEKPADTSAATNPDAKENLFTKTGELIKSVISAFPPLGVKNKLRGLSPDQLTGLAFLSQNKTKKTAISIVAIVLILLVVSSVLGKFRQEEERRTAVFNQAYDQANNKYEEGKAIIDLNNTQARNYLNASKTLLEEKLLLLNKKSKDYIKGQKLLAEINVSLAEISGIIKAENPEVFYDLTLIKDKAGGDLMSLYDNKTLGVLDRQNSSVYLLDISSKSPQTVSDSGFKNASYFVQGVSSFLYTKDKGVIKIDENKKITNPVPKDEDWVAIGDIGTFGGNIYLLDKSNSAIIKYMPVEGGYSDSKNYLPTDLKPDFGNAKQLVIDGYVWVFNSNGVLLKYGQGRSLDFSLSGLDQPFNSPTRMYSGDTTKSLYILDKGNNRVVVFNKESGVYQAQYQWSGISTVTDLVVVEEEKKMLLLSGSKLYVLPLR